MEKIWNDYVSLLDRNKFEKDGLKNHHSWHTSHYIESLSFAGKLNKKGYDCLTKLRKLRNDVVHRKSRDVTIEESWNCLNIAIFMVYNQLNQTDPFLDVEYKELKDDFEKFKESL